MVSVLVSSLAVWTGCGMLEPRATPGTNRVTSVKKATVLVLRNN